jgi:hypothetical protein
MLRVVNIGWLACLLAAVVPAQTGQKTSTSVENIVERMSATLQEHRAQVHPFTVKRGYLLRDKQDQEKAQVVANITVLPPDHKQYEIESSSGGIGEKILRDVLSKETEPQKDEHRKELSTANYDFQLLGEDTLNGRRCYLLGLNPRREEKDLLRGRLWVDVETYNIHRIEGSPVKNPSWWIRDLQVLMNFGEVDGMWMRTFTQAAANIRFKGRYVMESRVLEYRAITQTASRSRRNPEILAGAAVHP